MCASSFLAVKNAMTRNAWVLSWALALGGEVQSAAMTDAPRANLVTMLVMSGQAAARRRARPPLLAPAFGGRYRRSRRHCDRMDCLPRPNNPARGLIRGRSM